MTTPPPTARAAGALRTLLRWSPLVVPIALPLAWSPSREWSAGLVVLGYLGFCALSWHRHRRAAAATPADALPVAYASQGGQARRLAERSAEQLRQAGLDACAVPLEALSVERLARLPRLLIVASTYGDGEAPDHAAGFLRLLARHRPDLAGLDYALLALGDSTYRHFCGFARQLDDRLRALGARPRHDRLEADRLDAGVLRRWQAQLGQWAGCNEFSDWAPADYRPWRLVARERLNPGSQGGAVYRLRLEALEPGAHWQAGDIAEVGPCHPPAAVAACLARLGLAPADPAVPDAGAAADEPRALAWHLARRQWPEQAPAGVSLAEWLDALPRLPHREYSIASVPEDGALELLVREVRRADGQPGLGSGWLCRHAGLGECIDLRLRANPGFHRPPGDGPLILIGNGTGLAGLRAHLRACARLGQHGHWLLFGERNAAHDRLLGEELDAWLASGLLARLDLAFSRDGATKDYVQHRLRDAADSVRAWVDAGAGLLVCGSLEGMGREVDTLLRGILGDPAVDRLAAEGRYRRDLY